MKVVYDHQAFSLQNTGGVSRYFFELAKYFSQSAQIEPVALLGFSSNYFPFGDVLQSNGNVVHWGKRLFPSGMMTYALNEVLLNSLAVTLGQFDIYHNTLYRFMPFIRARRFVATHHDCVQERFPQFFDDRKRIFQAKRNMFAKADLIFCVSESSRVDLEEFYGVRPDRTKVVYNGVSEMRRIPGGEEQLRKLIAGQFILYVGTRYRYKNFLGLLEAILRSGIHHSYSLLALGGGPPSIEEINYINHHSLQNVVRIIPEAPAALLAESYFSASLLVYPSFYEGFGLPPLEAMQMGCPVLAARNPATYEICGDAAFFFDPYSLEEFSEQLKVSLSDSTMRKTLVNRGFEMVNKYSWARCAESVLSGYQSLV